MEVNFIQGISSEQQEGECESDSNAFDLMIEELSDDELEIEPLVNHVFVVGWQREPLEIEPRVQLRPSVEEPPKLELKPLPENLEYAYLGENESLPVIISSDLTTGQKEALLDVLRENREAIGWTMADIKGISPTIVQHRIHLIDDAKPTRDAQRRLNPVMKEAVRKDILKCLDHGIIYPISDSSWVSSVQVVPKKSGITVIQNEAKELIPTRIQTGW